MGLLGMAVAITVPFLVLYATQHLGMTKGQYGLLMALAAGASFTVNSIVARFSDSGKINRKYLIITALIMGALCFSIYFYIHTIWVFIALYAMFQGLAAPAMPQMYASARESINESAYKDRSIFANTVLRSTFSLGFLFGPLIGTVLLSTFGYDGLFGGTVALFLTVLVLLIIFYKEPKKLLKMLSVILQKESTKLNERTDIINTILSIHFVTCWSVDVYVEYAVICNRIS